MSGHLVLARQQRRTDRRRLAPQQFRDHTHNRVGVGDRALLAGRVGNKVCIAEVQNGGEKREQSLMFFIGKAIGDTRNVEVGWNVKDTMRMEDRESSQSESRRYTRKNRKIQTNVRFEIKLRNKMTIR